MQDAITLSYKYTANVYRDLRGSHRFFLQESQRNPILLKGKYCVCCREYLQITIGKSYSYHRVFPKMPKKTCESSHI